MKVLYIHHVSVIGGSSRSLYELISNLPKTVQPTVMCPIGEFNDFLQDKNIPTINVRGVPQFDNTRIGFYRRLRWLILLRELFYLPFFIQAIYKCKEESFDIVHINEITQLFSIVFAKKIAKKVIVHTRSVQRVSNSWRNKIIRKILLCNADLVVAIDETVRSSLPDDVPVEVVHNGITLDNVIPHKKSEKFTVGIVSNFQRYKGILEFIDAANICINEYNLDINFVVYGASYSKNQKSIKERVLQMLGFRENLEEIIKTKLEQYHLESKLKLKGYVGNHNEIYNYIDILVFPSHLNAVGRPVFEAGFYGIPSIVAIKDPIKDTFVDGVTGLAMEEKNSQDFAQKIKYLYENPDKVEKMGENAAKSAYQNFDSQKNSIKIFEIYKR